MEITGILGAASWISSALGLLTRGDRPAQAPASNPPDASAPQAGEAPANAGAFRDVLAGYDVRAISPRQFSEMIQKLYEAGGLTDPQFHELSQIRVDLDLDGADPDDPLDLLDFYLDKLRRAHDELEDLRESATSAAADPPPAAAATARRLQWLEKFALIQSAPDAIALNTVL